jgi:hypothetical protein
MGQKLRDFIDELFDATERYVRIRTQPVIGDRLDIVGLGQEFAQLTT